MKIIFIYSFYSYKYCLTGKIENCCWGLVTEKCHRGSRLKSVLESHIKSLKNRLGQCRRGLKNGDGEIENTVMTFISIYKLYDMRIIREIFFMGVMYRVSQKTHATPIEFQSILTRLNQVMGLWSSIRVACFFGTPGRW